MKQLKIFLLTSIAILFTACGGGSSDDTGNASSGTPLANDFTMILDVNESNMTTNWIIDSNASSASIATIDTQGVYGICSIDGNTINYLQNVETNETDTCVIDVKNSLGSSVITVTIKSLYWKQVSVGDNHSVAIKSDGTLWAWGYNYYGQLGDGTKTDRRIPVQEKTKANNWKQVSAGGIHTVAIKNDGTLWAWGYNRYGGLGDGTTIDKIIPTQELRHESDWNKINAGGAHTLAIKTDNTLWACGLNDAGQVGNGTIMDRTVLTQEYTKASDWQSVDGGYNHSIALKYDNTLWIWGSNKYGQLGDGTTVNKYVPSQEITNASDWDQISAGHSHNVALKLNGTVWAWGHNYHGQIGDGTPYNPASSDIVTIITQEITKANDWESISAGAYHTVAIKNNGTLWAWGYNNEGQLGDGTMIPKSIPTQEHTKSNNWTRVDSSSHNLAIKNDSTIWAWGWNYYGQLGDDDTTNKL